MHLKVGKIHCDILCFWNWQYYRTYRCWWCRILKIWAVFYLILRICRTIDKWKWKNRKPIWSKYRLSVIKKYSEQVVERWRIPQIDFLYASYSIKECANHKLNGPFFTIFLRFPFDVKRSLLADIIAGQCVRLKNDGHNADNVSFSDSKMKDTMRTLYAKTIEDRACAVSQSRKYFLGRKFLSRFSFHSNLRKQKLIHLQRKERLSYLIYMRKKIDLLKNFAVWQSFLQQFSHRITRCHMTELFAI